MYIKNMKVRSSNIEKKKYISLLDITRLGIGHFYGEFASEIDWPFIHAISVKQGLLGIIIDGIEKLPEEKRPSKELLLGWIGEVFLDYEYRYKSYCSAILDLASFYNGHGLKMMILKGYACSLDWPKPAHRPCGDIDIWQFGKQKEADELLQKEKGVKVDKLHHHHTIFCWREFTVENHYDFVNVHDSRSSRDLETIFKELGKDDSHYVEVNDATTGSATKVYLPSLNLHALFLIRHAVSHFASSNINLRQVLDWGFFVEKHTKEVDWDWLIKLLDRFHMKDFFNCLNAICVEDLGFVADIFPGVQFSPQLKERILEDILNPNYSTEEPVRLIPRLLYKFKRWEGNAWKQEVCYKENRWTLFWKGLFAHILKPLSF